METETEATRRTEFRVVANQMENKIETEVVGVESG